MLSLRPITDWESILAERSIVSAFSEGGFVTYWISCQEADSWAGINPVVAEEAAHIRYLVRTYDGSMLPELRAVLDAAPPGEKLFFVLHSMGSHFTYSRRYPPEFARFRTIGNSRRGLLVDDYDNSVLYTDWFVSEIIATLDQHHRAAALFYISDHGENLLDDDAELLGHGIGNRYDLATAALIWLSPVLRARVPDMVRNASANSGARLSLANVSHSLLDLAGIDTPRLDRSMSIFSPAFVTRPRWYIVRGKLLNESAMSNATVTTGSE
jgi:heptose-I-phosphate ethanolaminephosphotransferase